MEFLLVAPFMVIILGILTEYAYALNVNMTITQGLKDVTASMYSDIKPNMAVADINDSVLLKLKNYLDENNISTASDNNLKVSYVRLGDTTVFTSTYTYIPAFTLPSVYIRFIPKQLDFFSTSAVPTAYLNPNNYGNSIDTNALSGIWTGQKGAATDTIAQNKILFLKMVTPAKYNTLNWSGDSDNCVLDADTGLLEGMVCGFNGVDFKTYLLSNGYKNVIFVHDVRSDWESVRNSALAIADATTFRLGDYDMLSFVTNKVLVYGTTVFVYSASLDPKINNLR